MQIWISFQKEVKGIVESTKVGESRDPKQYREKRTVFRVMVQEYR